MYSADNWIKRLNLQRHPEGGYYAETYRAPFKIENRAVATGIYFLLTSDDVSHFHRIDADEMWHFYTGDPITVHMIDPEGKYSAYCLGSDPAKGQAFQAVVPAGSWFGASVNPSGSYALVGCTVSPGFEFDGFELAQRQTLISQFPEHADIIRRLTSSQ